MTIRLKKKTIACVLCLLVFFNIIGSQAFAEERPVFVGDIINIEISTLEYSEAEISEAFKEFEIVEIKNEKDGYLVSLRSFETGEKKVQLGDTAINIIVKSTLDEIERDDVFEGDLTPKEAENSISWLPIFCVLLLIFLVSGGFILTRLVKKRKSAALSPYQQFINQTKQVNLQKEDALVNLTYALKEYLGAKYHCYVIGKTSGEIMESIGQIMQLEDKLLSIQAWLEQCDYYKYTGNKAGINQKQTMLDQLCDIVKNIEETKEAVG